MAEMGPRRWLRVNPGVHGWAKEKEQTNKQKNTLSNPSVKPAYEQKDGYFFSSVKLEIKPKCPSHYPPTYEQFFLCLFLGEGFACELIKKKKKKKDLHVNNSMINYLWCYRLCMTLSPTSYKCHLPLSRCPISGSVKLHLGIT